MPKSLKDYAAALQGPQSDPYTHEVLTAQGLSFSIHKSEEAANETAGIIGGTVRPLVTKLSRYWDDTELGARYDH